ncbi:ACP S-malonyltransferase [Syntrophomonas erecta]
MARIALLFPGQGAQRAGMGKEFAEHFEEAAGIFQRADNAAGFSLSNLCFEGPQEKLDMTRWAQPALLTTCIAMLEVVRNKGINPQMLAGLSLGEYTALTAAGAIDFEQALNLVSIRGKLMQEAVPENCGAMAAVTGLENARVEEACEQAEGVVGIANYNCPGQVVISGEKIPVEQAGAIIKEMGGRVIPLAVSVPSHSPLMMEAAQALKPYLTELEWNEPLLPVVSNVNARENSRQDLPGILARQLFSPVLWEHSIRYMRDKVDYFIEIGPGNTLAGLVKRIDRQAFLGSIHDVNSLNKVLERVKAL